MRLHLNRWILRTLTMALMLALVTGCASNRKDGSTYRTDADVDYSYTAAEDDPFARGADKSPSPQTFFAMAKLLIAQGKDAQADLVLRRILQEHPRFLPAYNARARVLLRHRRFDEAIRTLQAGLEVHPGDSVLLNNLGMVHLITGDYGQALGLFTEAVGQAPDNTRYRANMAAALALLGRTEEARSLYEQILPPSDVSHNLQVLAEARTQGPASRLPAATPDYQPLMPQP